MLTAFKVIVELFNDRYVAKDIIEQEVLTITEKWVTFNEMGDCAGENGGSH